MYHFCSHCSLFSKSHFTKRRYVLSNNAVHWKWNDFSNLLMIRIKNVCSSVNPLSHLSVVQYWKDFLEEKTEAIGSSGSITALRRLNLAQGIAG